MEKYVTPPKEMYEFLLGYPWPIQWGYWLLIGIIVVGAFRRRWNKTAPQWLMALPVFWFAWQFLSGTRTVDSQLTVPTLKHFAACLACFYLGAFRLGSARNLFAFWIALVCAFVLVLLVGLEQHFGGLEQTRRYFYMYVYPTMTEAPPPEYLKKISSNRIFSTLFYPNALAGALLLLLPSVLSFVLQTRRMTIAAKSFLAAMVGLAAMACLFWSGSKGGWLLMLLLGLLVLLRLPFRTEYKVVLVSCALVAGLTGFFWKYSKFFQRGATSVSARFDYWRAAIETVKEHPLVGTGPGTFAVPYQRIKRAESEMARLVHNDYLEQASDSGIPAFLVYSLFIIATLIWTYPKGKRAQARGPDEHHEYQKVDWPRYAIWLGLLGWSLQGLFEFGLYIPALSWTAFALAGYLLGSLPVPEPGARENQIKSTKPAAAG